MGLRQAIELMKELNKDLDEPIASVFNISEHKFGLIIMDEKSGDTTVCRTFTEVLAAIR